MKPDRDRMLRVIRTAAALAFLTTAVPSLATDSPRGVRHVAPPATAEEAEQRLAGLEEQKKKTEVELDVLAKESNVVKARRVVRGRAYYKAIRAGFLPIGGGFDALVDHAVRVERLRQAILQDGRREVDIAKRSRVLRSELARVEIERGPLVVQRDALRKAQAMVRETEERRSAFARAFEKSERPDYVAIYGAGLGSSDEAGQKSFASQKGRLSFPIAGRAEVKKERRASGSGMFFSAPSGTAVRAVATARVVFADVVDGYGKVVLLDHGDRWYTLYAGLSSADVRVGDTVPAGARIGATGLDFDAGGQNATGLWFEVRRGSETVDPAPWVGL